MYIKPTLKEWRFNLGYAYADTGDTQHSFNILTSKIVGSDPGADYDFVSTGVAYGMNHKGFLFEVGLAKSWKDNLGNVKKEPVLPCGYMGYVYRFGAND